MPPLRPVCCRPERFFFPLTYTLLLAANLRLWYDKRKRTVIAMPVTGNLRLIRIREHPEWVERAADWFSEKWPVPREAYRDSQLACTRQKIGIPQWYIVTDVRQRILAGTGVIDNDYHDRKDLTPNLCALYVEESCRLQGIARTLLDVVRADMRELGFSTLYLLTDHTQFYEKCGWSFYTMVQGDNGSPERLYRTNS